MLFFDKSIKDLIIIWELTVHFILHFCSVLAPPACCLPGHNLGPVLYTGYAICCADSAKDPLPQVPFQEWPSPQNSGHIATLELCPECSLGKVIVLSTIKRMKCRLKHGVGNIKRSDRQMESLNTYFSRDSIHVKYVRYTSHESLEGLFHFLNSWST